MNPNSVYPAHIVIQEKGGKLIQTVEEHLRNAAAIASNTGKPYGLEKAAYLLGMVHDAGKFSDEFARYIEKVHVIWPASAEFSIRMQHR